MNKYKISGIVCISFALISIFISVWMISTEGFFVIDPYLIIAILGVLSLGIVLYYIGCLESKVKKGEIKLRRK